MKMRFEIMVLTNQLTIYHLEQEKKVAIVFVSQSRSSFFILSFESVLWFIVSGKSQK
jgi:hypothetical protein